ncbi:MAG TPA: type 1 glutamine amidotransferase domain-containing protein [Oscillatoriaceae cyanobacterium]
MTEPKKGNAQVFTGSQPTVAERPPQATGQRLAGKKVAAIVADGFEQTELDVPMQRLRDAGATVEVLAPDDRHLAHIEGESHGKPAAGVKADKLLKDANPDDYDALLIPGGLKSPDTMRQSSAHLAFVRAFVNADKPIGAICHGPWLLADTDVLSGKTVTSWPGIRRDLERAGAVWVDRPVVRDEKMVFSRKPADAEQFGDALIELVAASTRA